MNNSKRRRLAKEEAHVKGPSGEPHPFGNRAHRRSPQGKQEFELMFQKFMAQQELGMAKDQL